MTMKHDILWSVNWPILEIERRSFAAQNVSHSYGYIGRSARLLLLPMVCKCALLAYQNVDEMTTLYDREQIRGNYFSIT